MSGALIKLDEVNVTSDVATIELGAANWDNTYDVYVIKLRNLETSSGTNVHLYGRVLTGGTAQTDATYDVEYRGLWAAGSYQNGSFDNQTFWYISGSAMNNVETEGKESLSGMLYLYNFNETGEYSYMSKDTTTINADGQTYGGFGGGMKKVAEANNGMQFLFSGGNIRTGDAILYGLHK